MKEQSSSTTIDAHKNPMSLSNHRLYQLVSHDQKFISTVKILNNLAKESLNDDKFNDAVNYISEAEKVLEYAASCGKNIDRNLIVCVLQNEACCYQKLWDHQRCCTYLQALIFNLSEHLESVETSSRSQSFLKQTKNKSAVSEISTKMLEGKSIHQRMQLCKYQLQYCAINSQIRNHQKALSAGKTVVRIIKKIFKELKRSSQSMNCHQSLSEIDIQQLQQKIRVINGIAQIQDEIQPSKIQHYIITAKYYFWKWNTRKLQQKNDIIKETLKNFSIGSIMQIKPKLFEDRDLLEVISFEKYPAHNNCFQGETYIKLLNKVLFLSASYFTIATELRLIATDKHRASEEAKIQSIQFIESKIYHLISLIIVCIYVPFDMMYIRHILSSYSNHYGVDLSLDGNSYVDSSKVMKDIFDKEEFSESTKLSHNGNTKRDLFAFEDSIRISDSEDIKKKKKKKVKTKSLKKSMKNIFCSKEKTMKVIKEKHKKNNSEFSKKSSKTQENEKVPIKGSFCVGKRKGGRKQPKTMKHSGWDEPSSFNDRSEQEYYFSSPFYIKEKLTRVIKEKKGRKKVLSSSKSKSKNKKLKRCAPKMNQSKEKKPCLIQNINKYYF